MVRIINIDTKNKTIRVSNGDKELEWFTTDTGSHVPLKKGQSKAEAIKEHFGDKKSDTKRSDDPVMDELMGYMQKRAKQAQKNKPSISKSDKSKIDLMAGFRNGTISEEEFMRGYEELMGGGAKTKQQPAGQDKGTDEDGRVWIKMGGAIIPLRDGVSADDIDPKMLATPEEIEQGRAKYDGIKDRQDAAREKAKSGKIMHE